MFGIKTKIVSVIKNFSGPSVLMLSPIGYDCNNKCIMCWRNSISDSDRKNIIDNDIELYRKVINKLPFTVKTIEIQGGGEPLLYKDISTLFELVKKKYTGGLITNGIFLNLYKDVLIKNNWDYIRISINSATRDTYKKVNGSDSFEKVLNNIKEFNFMRNKSKTKLILHFVIQKFNFFEINELFKIAKENEIDELSFDYVLPFGNYKESLVINENEWVKIEKDIKNILNNKNICKNNLDKILYMRKNHPFWQNKNKNDSYLNKHSCSIAKNTMYVLSDGTCLPCCIADKNIFNLNVKNMSIGKIWKKYRSLKNNIKNKNYFDFCKEFCNYKID